MGTSAERMDAIRSPYDGTVVGEMPLAGEADVEAAIVAAQRGFDVIDNMPFGGWKESGLGREGTRFAMQEMSEIKHLVINYN